MQQQSGSLVNGWPLPSSNSTRCPAAPLSARNASLNVVRVDLQDCLKMRYGRYPAPEPVPAAAAAESDHHPLVTPPPRATCGE